MTNEKREQLSTEEEVRFAERMAKLLDRIANLTEALDFAKECLVQDIKLHISRNAELTVCDIIVTEGKKYVVDDF